MTTDKKTIRNFGLSTASVKNRTTVMILIAIIFITGIVSYKNMLVESFPELVIPKIFVGIPYPGNAPSDMEEMITEPIEQEINGISGVDKITSTSIQGYVTMVVEFSFDIDPSEALRKVKDAVDKSKADDDYPKDAMEPNIFELDVSEFPIMNINLAIDDKSSVVITKNDLKNYADYIKDEIENLDQISKVNVKGSPEKEVKIQVNPYEMAAREVSFQDIENSIKQHNLNLSLGDIRAGEYLKTLRVIGKFSSINDIKHLIVKHEKQNLVYLQDIANVVFEESDPDSYAREFGESVIMLDVVKRSSQNLLETTDAILKILDDAVKQQKLKGALFTITNDMSSKTRNQVSSLENNIIMGIILVVLVLVFFIGLRNAMFVGIAIPLSMFMAFIILSALGVTLNMIVLFALILALGMLVDNGIVVVENIYRLMDEGKSPIQASIHGVGEVAWPIIASTATTLAAFLPLAFWPGIMGEFMKYLPITLIIVLGSSLFVGLVINPVLTSLYMKVGKSQRPNKKKVLTASAILTIIGIFFLIIKINVFGNLLLATSFLLCLNLFFLDPTTRWFQQVAIPKLESVYSRFLSFALRGEKPVIFLMGTVGLLVISFELLNLFAPKVDFMPINEPSYVNIFIEKPIGTNIQATNKVTQKVESILDTLLAKYEVIDAENYTAKNKNFMVNSVIAQIGQGTSDNKEGSSTGNTPNKARVTVSFKDYEFRVNPKTGERVNSLEVMKDIQLAMKQVPGAKITIDKNTMGPPSTKPINIEVSGDDYDMCYYYALKLKRYIDKKKIPGIESLKPDVQNTKPEIIVNIDEEAAEQYGINNYQIASTIRTALFGKQVTNFTPVSDDYEINITLSDDYRYDINALLNQIITFRNPANGKISQVPISSVASITESHTYSAIKRKNLDRLVTLSSNVVAKYNATEVVKNIKSAIDNGFAYPKDKLTISFTGQMEDQAKEMSFLSKALFIALALILFIIVLQFNALSVPIIVGSSVIFSLIGVLLGLVIFQMDFIIIMTMVGIISLAGIVVNNAIVLIDYTNLLILRRQEELNIPQNARLPMNEVSDCIVKSGSIRLRPVLLTAITTVLGLIPMAIGMNMDFFGLFESFDAHLFFGGDNAIFWGPMAWTIIFGLSFATFLTLVIVPVMFLLIKRLKYKVIKIK